MDDMKCIIGIVERGRADLVVDEAKKAGAQGATIFFGRGTGTTEAKKFFNISVESAKEVIIILAPKNQVEKIVGAMTYAGQMKKAGNGIVFTMDVESLVGFHHRKFTEKQE